MDGSLTTPPGLVSALSAIQQLWLVRSSDRFHLETSAGINPNKIIKLFHRIIQSVINQISSNKREIIFFEIVDAFSLK